MARASFQAYVNIFQQDNTSDNVLPSAEISQSKELDENGWCVVRENDPALSSVTKEPHDNSSNENESTGECKLRRKNSATRANNLCGYLNKCKIGSRGKHFKRRWFVHADKSCKLLYYRTPQDVIPLGEIDVAQATFSLDVQPELSANVFRIM